MSNDKSYSLTSQIRLKINIRILACFLLAMLTLLFLTFRDITNNINLLDKKLDAVCADLEEFIVSQVLIGSSKSIDLKIDELNQLQNFKLAWIPDKTVANPKVVRFKAPFDWEYNYNLKSLDGRKFGVVIVKGSFNNDKAFASELIIRGLLVLSFFVFLFILLLPLTKKIPKEMLLNPIFDILSLLNNPESYFKNERIKKFTEVEEIKNKIVQLMEKVKKDSHDAAIGKMAVQVAHDIRSPLTALDVVVAASISRLPEDQRLIIRNATQRINDMANNLLRQHGKNCSNNIPILSNACEKPSLIMSMLDSLLSEKRAQYSDLSIFFDLNITEGSHTVFSHVNPVEFKRVISNVINNSVEATHQSGRVTVSLIKDIDNAIIQITDNGCGIPKDILPKLFSFDVSFGKKNGYGLGLQHAFSMINSWKGKIEIASELGTGTTVSISLPLANPPSWFVEAIKIHAGNKIVIFDDDASIHHVWSQRFNVISEKIELIHFSSSEQLKSWLKQLNDKINNYIFLMDHELIGEIETGLNLIEDIGLHQQAILVTSHYEENNILERCIKANIRLLPKSMSAYIPIQLADRGILKYDAVLIDDDPMIRMIWEISAQARDKKIIALSSMEEFLFSSKEIHPDSVIYIDSNLGNFVKGEVISKEIYEKGFKTIYLATGEQASRFESRHWLHGVIGKMPPWEEIS